MFLGTSRYVSHIHLWELANCVLNYVGETYAYLVPFVLKIAFLHVFIKTVDRLLNFPFKLEQLSKSTGIVVNSWAGVLTHDFFNQSATRSGEPHAIPGTLQ